MKLINSGKAIFQDWLNVEVGKFANDKNIIFLELLLKVIDKVSECKDFLLI